jgi:hypothetical protein
MVEKPGSNPQPKQGVCPVTAFEAGTPAEGGCKSVVRCVGATSLLKRECDAVRDLSVAALKEMSDPLGLMSYLKGMEKSTFRWGSGGYSGSGSGRAVLPSRERLIIWLL